MSLFGAMNTAISGLSAQAAAFGNISDNIANSQTVGYKGVQTTFIDYITESGRQVNGPDSVVTKPHFTNSVQGALSQSSGSLSMAITGQGFFPVSTLTSRTGSISTFSPVPHYTRAGDFSLDQAGYVANSAGQYLNGWTIDPVTGLTLQNAIAPIQVTQTIDRPVATTQLKLDANLPATPAVGTPVTSQINIYDSLGTSHAVVLNWTQTATNTWTVGVNVPDDIAAAAVGTAQVKFGPAASGNPVADGTVGSIGAGTGTVTTTPFVLGNPADLSFTTNFGNGPQTCTLDMGVYGQSLGVTQYAGTTYTLRGLTQNGVPPGSFSSVSTDPAGKVVVNYDNGQSRAVAQVPVIVFNNPDGLHRESGQAFTATEDSGTALANTAGTSGAGTIVTGSIEQSNVDIATEFTRLIVAQRAYSANAKMITTADELLQQTLDLKR